MSDFDPNDRGEYPIGPEPAPNPRPFGAPRVRINTSMMGYDAPGSGQPIPYARPMPAPEPQPSISSQVQYLLGILSPFAVVAILWALSGSMRILRIPPAAFVPITWIAFGAFIAMVVYVSTKLKWKAFLPGVLTIVLLIPLILFAICGIALAAIIGPGGFK